MARRRRHGWRRPIAIKKIATGPLLCLMSAAARVEMIHVERPLKLLNDENRKSGAQEKRAQNGNGFLHGNLDKFDFWIPQHYIFQTPRLGIADGKITK